MQEKHLRCFYVERDYDKNKKLYEQYFKRAQSQGEIMTMNIIRVVCFLIKQDVSINVSEKLLELL